MIIPLAPPLSTFRCRDKQHAAHLIGLGSLYPCPDLVDKILAPESGVTKEILDLGAIFPELDS
jgi:hypothetical protein